MQRKFVDETLNLIDELFKVTSAQCQYWKQVQSTRRLIKNRFEYLTWAFKTINVCSYETGILQCEGIDSQLGELKRKKRRKNKKVSYHVGKGGPSFPFQLCPVAN